MTRIGIIGGSGLYDIEGIENKKWQQVQTPFGDPSDELGIGTLNGRDIVFLARHGHGHRLLPHELNYRANIYAMKILGVTHIISVSAVGSFKKELKPLDIVLVDQFFDRTKQARKNTFFGDGIAVHIPFAQPLCENLRRNIYEAGKKVGATMHWGGTYINMEGPAFSTLAESLTYQSWGMDVIGMTQMNEAKLAREAEICYATMAMVTDYDCWYEEAEESTVNIEMIVENLQKNADTAKEIILRVVPQISEERNCDCAEALENAIITEKSLVPKETLERLKPIIGKYFN